MINEKQVAVLEKSLAPVITKAEKIVIAGTKDMELASDMRSKLKAYIKQVKDTKESVTKPINESLKKIREMFSPLENKINAALANIDDAMISYQTEEKRIADEEAAKIASRIGAGKGKIKLETAMDKIAEIDKPENKVGGTYFKTVKTYKVVDVSKLPAKYILPNDVEINTAMKAGIELPGVEYGTEQRPVNSRS